MLYTTVIAVLTQLTFALRSSHSLRILKRVHVEIGWPLRVYGVARRDKLCGGALCFLILAQLCFGLYFTVMYAKTAGEFLSHFWLACCLISATSAAVTTDRLGRVRELCSPTVASWGTDFHHLDDRFRYALICLGGHVTPHTTI